MASHHNFVGIVCLAEGHNLTGGVTNVNLGVDFNIVSLGEIKQIGKYPFRP
jgi:hypothetical protein